MPHVEKPETDKPDADKPDTREPAADALSTREFVARMPKVELHLHIEGTLEPDLLLHLAHKHGINLPWQDLAAVKQAYQFDDLQSFLDLYYLGASVLVDEADFYELMWRYLKTCREENILHTEIMFDPQTHTDRGVAFATVINGLRRAMDQAAQEWGQSSQLIMCFLRHLPETSALQTLEMARPFREHITTVGLDSAEVGNPPENFARVFAKAGEQGYRRVAHAGEEGPPTYITSALDNLKVTRIDHGVSCLQDAALVLRLVREAVPLTVCPQSNIKLRVFPHMRDHPLLDMLNQGLCVTANSDDPAYFGGYLNQNLISLVDHLALTREQAVKLVDNAISASFIGIDDKARLKTALMDFTTAHSLA